MSRLKRALSRAKFAAIGAAVGGGLGGLVGRSAASTGAGVGALVGATIGEKRVEVGSIVEDVKNRVRSTSSSRGKRDVRKRFSGRPHAFLY